MTVKNTILNQRDLSIIKINENHMITINLILIKRD
jgi:hypothetical protein